ncbi:MAG: hypothetical protein ACP5M7_00250 [Thermoproteota archaeon]
MTVGELKPTVPLPPNNFKNWTRVYITGVLRFCIFYKESPESLML